MDRATGDTPTIVKVKNISDPNKIAGVIAHAAYERKVTFVRAIGANAVNQAVKACAIARGYAATRRLNLLLIPSFDSVDDEHEAGKKISLITFEVITEPM